MPGLKRQPRHHPAPEADPLERAVTSLALRRRDAILEAIAKSARELLRTNDLSRTMPLVLEMIGSAAQVERVHLFAVSIGAGKGAERVVSHVMWHDPAIPTPPMFSHPSTGSFADFGLDGWPERLANGETIVGHTRDFPPGPAGFLRAGGIDSTLVVPIFMDGQWWGFIAFDACRGEHEWLVAEVETIGILAELVGGAAARSQRVRQLYDANRIIENSPTVLYRLKPEPPFEVTYLSRNFSRSGVDVDAVLAGTETWFDHIQPDTASDTIEKVQRLVQGYSVEEHVEFSIKRSDGAVIWLAGEARPVRDADGRLTAIEGIVVDITERKAINEQLAALARTDALTSLPNRPAFLERLELACGRARRGLGDFAVLYLDLDHFKDVNDTLGHPVGDALLREVAMRLKQCVRTTDLVSRFGGDEFAILVDDMEKVEDVEAVAAKIGVSVALPFNIDGNQVNTTASIGIVPYDPQIEGPEAMLIKADLALYRAKDEGRNQYRFHVADLDRQAHDRMATGSSLHGAIERQEFELVYQPQVELGSGRIVGLEALLRWNHPTRGRVPPAVFIPVAESNGTIFGIGRWVFEEACRQIQRWRAAGLTPPVVGVNVSAAQFQFTGELDRIVDEALSVYGVEATAVELELTESVLMETTQRHRDALDRLSRSGIRIAVDDFGTGFSSLAYLTAFKVSRLKLAGQFIDDMAVNPANAAIVRATASLARELGIELVAEGVMTAEQETMLMAAGCRYAQGFYFGEPMSAAAIARLLEGRPTFE